MRDYFTQTNVAIGKEVRALTDEIDLQASVESMLKEQRDAQSGVSVNEEVSQLLSSQFAFQGCSRVMAVINSMLEVVVNELVRR
jgi:flagellar hook-associated protein 1 FlgK